MPKIKAVTDAMIKRAEAIEQGTTSLFNSQKSVTKILMNMDRCFSGRVPRLMTERMILMEREYARVNLILTRYSAFLKQVAQQYEWSDEQAARWARALTGDGWNGGIPGRLS